MSAEQHPAGVEASSGLDAASPAAKDTACAAAAAEGPPPLGQQDSHSQYQWVGEPTREAQGRRFYAAFEAGRQRFELGEAVYLAPDHPGEPPRVARLESLHEQAPPGGGTGGGGMEGGSGGPEKWAGVRRFYRPAEVQVDQPLQVVQGELLYSENYATHPLAAVCGKCQVLTPAQAGRRPGSNAADPCPPPDTFVCSLKYLPEEKRVVPLDDGVSGDTLAFALQGKPYEVVDGQAVQQAPTAAEKAQAQAQEGGLGEGQGLGKRGRDIEGCGAAEEEESRPGGGEEAPLLLPDLAEPSTAEQQVPPKRRRHEKEAQAQPSAPGAATRPTATPAVTTAGKAGKAGGGVTTRRATRSLDHGVSAGVIGGQTSSEETAEGAVGGDGGVTAPAGGAVGGGGTSNGRVTAKAAKEMHGR